MEYGTDPLFFTQGLEQPFEETLILAMSEGLTKSASSELGEFNAVTNAALLWEIEAESRVYGDEPTITQFEFGCLTNALLAYSDYAGVYSPKLWELFVQLTANPMAPPLEQEPLRSVIEAEGLSALVHGELMRMRSAARLNSPRDGGETGMPQRYSPPACQQCESSDVFVASSRPKFRYLCCRSCGARWKAAR